MGIAEAVCIGIFVGCVIGVLIRPLVVSLAATIGEIVTTWLEDMTGKLIDRYGVPGTAELCHECPYRKWVKEQPGVPDFVMEDKTDEN